jgi:hypothetical protein
MLLFKAIASVDMIQKNCQGLKKTLAVFLLRYQRNLVATVRLPKMSYLISKDRPPYNMLRQLDEVAH